MVAVKICGITRLEDAAATAHFGAAAAGFVFSESPRRIDLKSAAEISAKMPPFFVRIGVFVNEPLEKIESVLEVVKLQAVQLHGEEEPDFCDKLRLPVIKAIRVSGDSFLPEPARYVGIVSAFLLDTYTGGKMGGTGKSFDWEAILEMKKTKIPIIVAGGLNSENVGRLIRNYRPYGVDISTGVEEEPGIKSHAKIQKFIERVREAEKDTVSE